MEKIDNAIQEGPVKFLSEPRKLLEGLEKGECLYFYIASLISADNLLSAKDCEESLKKIDFCLEILPENNIENKEKIEQMLIDGKKIVLRDLEDFKKGK